MLTAFCSLIGSDPQGAVRFAVVTNQEVAAGMWVTEDQSVYLHRHFNTSLVNRHKLVYFFIIIIF